jgi:lipid II:glycine glycyltransferase (peptidoglycan interpeptide bridge formation enzyme)
LELALASGYGVSKRYWLHGLALDSDCQTLYRGFSKDSVQRKIRRAEREGVQYEEGRTEALLDAFYQLLLATRKRHRLPPQPFNWFRNLAAAFGPAMKLRVARLNGRPIAAMVTLCHQRTTVYKYGASEPRFHPVGGMHLLFWRTIQDACASGHLTLDFGRCDVDNDGLATFKQRWGAACSTITYWRHPASRTSAGSVQEHAMRGGKWLLTHVPAAWRAAAGRLLYRHAA